MWTYIVRRLLLMIPTLAGVTVVSFVIMQLAPGDPLRERLGATGQASQSTQTREAYLIQKRDLKLDKPLLLNFRYFHDYTESVRQAAWVLAQTDESLTAALGRLADPMEDEPLERLEFLRQIHVEQFDERLADPRQHGRLAQAIFNLTKIWCEDNGTYAAPVVMELLTSSDSDPALQIGALRCLASMVPQPFTYTYSTPPAESQTPEVVATWRVLWDRRAAEFAPVDPERATVLRARIEELSALVGDFQLFDEMDRFDRDDLPVFAEVLLGESTLNEKVVCSLALKLYLGRPLRVDVPLSANEAEIGEVIKNWQLHFDAHQAAYHPSMLKRLSYIVADTQYAHMVWRLIRFDFGRSALKTRDPVGQLIWKAFVISAPLMLLSQVFIYIVAVPIGVLCAVYRGRLLDRLISLKLFLLYSIPPFVAGMLFLLFLCYGDYLKLFPMRGLHSEGADDFGWAQWLLDYAWHAVLPVTCLSLFSLAVVAMYARTSMLDVVEQDYIRTARAKGLSQSRVILKHALRNAMIPILTLFANFLPAMLGGSVIIEVLFGIPGMGRLSWMSIEQKDFPTLMALIYIDAIVVMVSILLTDLLYVLVDPRISFAGRGDSA